MILAGFGQFGSTGGRLLRANDARPVVLEVYFSDTSRLNLLHAAGAEEAIVLVIAVGDGDTALEIARTVRAHFPRLRILARAEERPTAFDLRKVGVSDVYRDTVDTSLRVGVDALRAVGVRAHRAHRSAQAFRRHPETASRAP